MTKNTPSIDSNRLYLYPILLLMIIPNIVWIVLDQRVWSWDQSWYGQVSVELFYHLIHSPFTWLQEMISAFGSKAPGTAWLGQFFVPLGQIIGSIDTGLLLSIVVTQFMNLLLTYHTILSLTNSQLISITCCIFAASAPLSVALTHQYFVEPLQTFAVAWVVLITAFSPVWSSRKIFLGLVSVASLGMLAKITFPLYVFIPILVSIFYIYKNRKMVIACDRENKKSISLLPVTISKYAIPIFLASGFLLWYGKNLKNIVSFSMLASSGDAALLYGEKADFLYKIQYWLSASQKSFFTPLSLVCLLVPLIYILIKLISTFKNKISKINFTNFKLDHFDVIGIASLAELVFTLSIFSFQVNQENRYLLPLMPYLGLLMAWTLKKVKQKVIIVFTLLVLTLQMFVVHSQAFGITPEDPSLSYWLYPIDRNNMNKQLLSKLVDNTCKDANEKNRYNIIGVELPWFNANSAAYFSAQQQLEKNFHCYYTSLGYAEQDTEKAWTRLFDLNINYFATLQSRSSSEVADPLNAVSLPILKRIQQSPRFKKEIFLDDQSDVILYKKIDP